MGSILDCSAVLTEFGQAMGHPEPVPHQKSPMSPRNGPAFVFLLGHWWEQLKEPSLGANGKLRGISGTSAGALARPAPRSRPEQQILKAPHTGAHTSRAFSQLILGGKKTNLRARYY